MTAATMSRIQAATVAQVAILSTMVRATFDRKMTANTSKNDT